MCVAEPRPCGGASCFPRHPRGEALLNDERPATRRANGSRAFLGEVFDPASRGEHARAGRLSAREAKPPSGGGAGRRPAPGESRYIATGTRAMSRLWAGLIALTAASRLSPMATAEGVELASPHPQARAYTLASRGDRASRPGGQERPQSAARCVGSTRNVAHGVAPDNPLQHSIQSGSDQGRATDTTRVWTTG